jgi:hypothetical protein
MKTSAARRGGFGRALLALWLLLFPLAAAVSAGVEKAPAGARAPALAPAAPAPAPAAAPGNQGVWGENRVRGSEPFFVRSRWGEILVIPDPRRGCVWVVARNASGRVDLYFYVENNPVNRVDPSGMISEEAAAELETLIALYGAAGASSLADTLSSILSLERDIDKPALRSPDDNTIEIQRKAISEMWGTVRSLKEAFYRERLAKGGLFAGGHIGKVESDILHDLDLALNKWNDADIYRHKVEELEILYAFGVQALKEYRGNKGMMFLNAFAQHTATFGANLAVRMAAQSFTEASGLTRFTAPLYGNPRLARDAISKARGATVVIKGQPLEAGRGYTMLAGGLDPATGTVYVSPGGHFDGMGNAGGKPTGDTPGLTLYLKGQRVYWANDSQSLNKALTPDQTAAVQRGLERAFPDKQVQQVTGFSELPK